MSRKSKQKNMTRTTFQILVALLRETKHGYRVKKEIEERTRGEVRLGAGTLYEALHRLERQGLVEEKPAPAGESGNPRWRFYRTTASGRKAVESELLRMESDVVHAREIFDQIASTG